MKPGANPAQPKPQLIWDTINGYQRTAALCAAIDLDLFTLIGDGECTADGLARRLHRKAA